MLSDDKGLVEFGGETNGKGLVNEIIHCLLMIGNHTPYFVSMFSYVQATSFMNRMVDCEIQDSYIHRSRYGRYSPHERESF